MEIGIDRDGIVNYWTILYLLLGAGGGTIFYLPFGIAAYGVGVGFPIIIILLGIPARQVDELKYWIENNCVRINEGLFFRRQKSIPFDKITDVMWHQGPLMRWLGIQGIRFQTAGSPEPEGTMIGVKNAQEVRDSVMSLIKEFRAV